MSYGFMALLFRQKYIKRWSLMHSTQDESLSEHSMQCALIAHCLALINRDIFGGTADPDEVAVFALYHDAPEVLCGDLPTPIKYYSEEMRKTYRKIEENAAKTLISKLPDGFKETYEKLLFEECDELTHRLVKTADKLCAYIKCRQEVKNGNREFNAALQSVERSLEESYNSDETRYFKDNFLPAFDLTIDEL